MSGLRFILKRRAAEPGGATMGGLVASPVPESALFGLDLAKAQISANSLLSDVLASRCRLMVSINPREVVQCGYTAMDSGNLSP